MVYDQWRVIVESERERDSFLQTSRRNLRGRHQVFDETESFSGVFVHFWYFPYNYFRIPFSSFDFFYTWNFKWFDNLTHPDR